MIGADPDALRPDAPPRDRVSRSAVPDTFR
jgi:hypothetical protein